MSLGNSPVALPTDSPREELGRRRKPHGAELRERGAAHQDGDHDHRHGGCVTLPFVHGGITGVCQKWFAPNFAS